MNGQGPFNRFAFHQDASLDQHIEAQWLLADESLVSDVYDPLVFRR